MVKVFVSDVKAGNDVNQSNQGKLEKNYYLSVV